ncbi:hypothetical protein CDD80_6590 [Ophiocordyceps camponoti-rufipedis]|uniref:Uncharacterized protein n=1 Tax=Ophiocordyceps camponoti-rufipedis TaxID=2004952 RepID=A0A2C5XSE8_9HYPO|nr:hypothetical protein CDD80_6590 [Ophiocordyceps camponoti-rufipedis]
MLILILTGAYHAITGAIGHDVNSAESIKCLLDDASHGLARSHVTESAQAVFMLVRYVVWTALVHATNRRYQIATGQSTLDERSADVARTAENLRSTRVDSQQGNQREYCIRN